MRGDMKDVHEANSVTGAAAGHDKEAWVEPKVVRMRAGDAENTVNPVGPDGTFASGS
jgi:hypothetical protein